MKAHKIHKGINENRSATAVSNSDTKQMKNSFEDLRETDTINMNAQLATKADFEHYNSNEPAQFMLPHNGPPNTKGYYNARNSTKTKKFTGGRPSKFSTAFKQKMIQNEWNGKKNPNNGYWYVMTHGQSNHVLPEIAIQIDHTTPWDSIETKLKEKPSSKLSSSNLQNAKDQGLVTSNGNDYTMYAARMYYHDVENLKPMAGSENAGKGANTDAKNDPMVSKKMQQKANQASGVFHNMLNEGVAAFKDWGEDVRFAEDIYNKIGEVQEEAAKATDYFISF